MTVSRFAIYNALGELQRWIVTDELTVDKCGVRPGEGILEIPALSGKDEIQKLITERTGLVPPVKPEPPPPEWEKDTSIEAAFRLRVGLPPK